jgi:hypothetical protein
VNSEYACVNVEIPWVKKYENSADEFQIYRAKPHVSGILCLVVRDHGRYAWCKEGITTKEINNMTLYMDIHRELEGLTEEAVAGAHARDLEVQGKYGAKYLKYWFDEGTGTVFCLIEAPSKEAAEAVHREAHGLMAREVIEIKEGS